MSYPGLVLAGHAGAGKDTVGRFIADRFDGTCTAFSADSLIISLRSFDLSVVSRRGLPSIKLATAWR